MPRFGRDLQLQVGTLDGEARQWRGLRVRFSVTHTRSSKPSRAKVIVYNLSADSRAFVERDFSLCWVRAGYRSETASDSPLPQVVFGDIDLVVHERKGADWVTTLHLGDGSRAYSQRIVRTVRMRRVDALSLLQEDMQERAGVAGDLIAESLERTRQRGLEMIERVTQDFPAGGDLAESTLDAVWEEEVEAVFDGPVGDAFGQVLPRGWGWSIVDGELRLVPPDGIMDDRALVLNASTGLVGTPKPKTKTSAGRPRIDGLEIVSLLVPSLRAGSVVRLESSLASGDYVIREVTHEGDTHGGDWYSTIDARER